MYETTVFDNTDNKLEIYYTMKKNTTVVKYWITRRFGTISTISQLSYHCEKNKI